MKKKLNVPIVKLLVAFFLIINLRANDELELTTIENSEINEQKEKINFKEDTIKSNNETENKSSVISLYDETFEEELKNSDCALIEFIVPWCQYCKEFFPKFENAAEIIKDEINPKIKLFKVDSEKNPNISEINNIFSYPTLKFFKNGNITEYEGSKANGVEIAINLKKNCNPSLIEYNSIYNIYKDLKNYLNYLVIFTESDLSGKYNEYFKEIFSSLEKSSNFHKDIIFAICPLEKYQCDPRNFKNSTLRNFLNEMTKNNSKNNTESEIFLFVEFTEKLGKLFIEKTNSQEKFFKLIFFKSTEQSQNETFFTDFDLFDFGEKKSRDFSTKLSYFLDVNGYDLISKLEDRTAEIIFTPNITSLFFIRNSTTEFTSHDLVIKSAAEKLKGKIYFLITDIKSELESRLADLLFIEPEDLPQVRIFYTLNDEEIRTYLLDFNFTDPNFKFTDEIVIEFYNNYTNNLLSPFYKSEPIPTMEENSRNKTLIFKIVGATYNDLVYNVDKFRIIEIFLPWEYFCKKLKPIYEQLAQKFQDYENLEFSELDFSKNEVPNNFIRSYPLIFFFRKGETKHIVYNGDRTLESLEDFILENLGLPRINRNKTDEIDEIPAPTQPVEEFFRVIKDENLTFEIGGNIDNPDLISENKLDEKYYNEENQEKIIKDL